MRTIHLLLCALAAMPAMAQKTYTLDECRTLALQANVKVRNADNSVKAAEETRKEAFTKYFPSLSATGTAYDANKGLAEINMGALGSMSLLKDGLMGGVTLTQPVFAGGQIVNANRLAKVNVQATALQRERSANDVRLTVEKYYWQVVVLKEKIKTVSAVESLLASLNKDVTTAVNAGVKNRNDLLQVQLRQNDMASTRLNLENNLSVCRLLLGQYIGIEGEADADSGALTVGAVVSLPAELYREPATAMSLTPEYRLLQANVEAEQLQKKMAVGKNMPTVGVGAGYLYDNLMGSSHTAGLVFASVSVPISAWWGGSHDIKKHKLQLANAQNTLAANAELLQIKIRKAWADLTNAQQQTQIASQSISQSEENLRLNRDYYKAGTSSMSDLLDAQMLYQQARDKYVDACSDYQIKKTEYLISVGE